MKQGSAKKKEKRKKEKKTHCYPLLLTQSLDITSYPVLWYCAF